MTTAVITTTTTTKSPVLFPQEQEQKSEQQQKMDDQLFQQFFQSLTSVEPTTTTSTSAIAMTEQEQQEQQDWFATSPEWFSAAMGTGQQSVHSTPEIATPQDMFLTSPTTEHVAFEKPGFADLDVSAILNSTLFEVPQQQQQQQPHDTATASIAAPDASASGDDLHAALATLATVTQSPVQSPPLIAQQPVVIPSPSSPQQQQTSPVINVMPTFSARKRKSDDMSADGTSSSPLDEAAIKRQKNTDAARRSRLRKAMKMEGLEKRVADLEKTNTTLLLRAAVLESEKSSLLAKEASYERRIKALEAQLAQAHQSLSCIGSRQ